METVPERSPDSSLERVAICCCWYNPNPAKTTSAMTRATATALMLRNLVQAGLIAEVNCGEKTRYAVTEDGFRYPATYRDFEGFARSFGVRL